MSILFVITDYSFIYKIASSSLDNTVEPLNTGHVGADHFVLCRKVVHSSEV